MDEVAFTGEQVRTAAERALRALEEWETADAEHELGRLKLIAFFRRELDLPVAPNPWPMAGIYTYGALTITPCTPGAWIACG